MLELRALRCAEMCEPKTKMLRRRDSLNGVKWKGCLDGLRNLSIRRRGRLSQITFTDCVNFAGPCHSLLHCVCCSSKVRWQNFVRFWTSRGAFPSSLPLSIFFLVFLLFYHKQKLISSISIPVCLMSFRIVFFRRGTCRGVARGQIPLDTVRRKSARRTRHLVQLSTHRHHHRRQRLQALGDRTAMLPDRDATDGPHQAERVHRIPQKVKYEIVV